MTFNQVLEEYEGKIETLAYQSKTKNGAIHMEHEDLVQELRIVLWRAYETYDKTKGIQFSTYFYTMANNRIVNIIREEFSDRNKANKTMTSLDDTIGEDKTPLIDMIECDSYSIEQQVSEQHLFEEVLGVDSMTEEEFDILRFILGEVNMNYLVEKYNKNRQGFYAKKDKMQDRIKHRLIRKGVVKR